MRFSEKVFFPESFHFFSFFFWTCETFEVNTGGFLKKYHSFLVHLVHRSKTIVFWWVLSNFFLTKYGAQLTLSWFFVLLNIKRKICWHKVWPNRRINFQAFIMFPTDVLPVNLPVSNRFYRRVLCWGFLNGPLPST